MHKPPVHYLVLIESDGQMVARLFDAQRRHVSDIDASSEEVSVMTQGLMPQRVANAPEWQQALQGDGIAQREAALVFTLDV